MINHGKQTHFDELDVLLRIQNVKFIKMRLFTMFYHRCLCLCFILNQVTNLLLTEREGRIGEYWPEVVAVRTERSEVRAKTTEGQYSPVRSRASEVSKLFIIWHHFSYETTLPVFHSSQFPARGQGKKPAIYYWLSNQFDDRCCRSAKTCVALE